VKKETQYIDQINNDFEINKVLDKDKIKTTDVNILLNRVRLDQKRTIRKRIIFSFLLISAISSLAFYFSI
tara:strand:+ start:284 stop:493 length:210 start_codon:yes stop_codon:yes gene_type:complete